MIELNFHGVCEAEENLKAWVKFGEMLQCLELERIETHCDL